jgi:hypothetical protein
MSLADRQRLETMSHQELVVHLQALQMTTLVPNVFTIFAGGLLFLGAVEGLAWLVRRGWPVQRL